MQGVYQLYNFTGKYGNLHGVLMLWEDEAANKYQTNGVSTSVVFLYVVFDWSLWSPFTNTDELQPQDG